MGCKGSEVRVFSPRPIKSRVSEFLKSFFVFRVTQCCIQILKYDAVGWRIPAEAPGGSEVLRRLADRPDQ